MLNNVDPKETTTIYDLVVVFLDVLERNVSHSSGRHRLDFR